jgi:hypothetical protein
LGAVDGAGLAPDAVGAGLGCSASFQVHLLALLEADGAACGVVFFLPPEFAITTITTITTTTAAVIADAMTVLRLRRLDCWAARAATSRSSRARAAARWRSLELLTS